MSRFDSAKHPNVQVHDSAYVDEPCEIGAGTKIWHFSHIMADATLGKNCNIGQNVVISPRVVLGDNVKVQNNVSIYTGVVLEDDVFCGPSTVFTNIVNPRSEIVRRDKYQRTLVRREPGRQLQDRLPRPDRAICVHRCRRSRRQGSPGLRSCRRCSGPASRVGVSMWRPPAVY